MWALLVGVSLVLSLNSCSKDPVIPEDETKNKLHEDPAKMTVRLVECHLHADWNEIQKDDARRGINGYQHAGIQGTPPRGGIFRIR